MVMYRRTTVMLEGEVYDALVRESLAEYKTAKSISKVMNEILKKSLRNKRGLMTLIYSKKVATTTAKEFEGFRRSLSKAV